MDSDEEDQIGPSRLNLVEGPPVPRGLFRELGERGEPELARLMDMGMDIERLLQVGMGGGLRDPILDGDDPMGFGSIFGFPPGHQPREL
jgi:hypothetical protein